MKAFLLKVADKSLALLGKQLVFTSCWIMCHRPEIPQEMLDN